MRRRNKFLVETQIHTHTKLLLGVTQEIFHNGVRVSIVVSKLGCPNQHSTEI